MASRNDASITMFHSSTNPPSPSRMCMSSPTKYPGSFRCSMHKKSPRRVARPLPRSPSSSNPHHWDSSMAFKAVSLKAILLHILKPSSHDLHRRKTFKPKPTRFCLMNGTNRDAVAVS